ncbi:MAG: flagellar hook assembly protein FlgD [Sulfuritalea sp.]|nr:flagellar hook assembly protein FlgD [Sulfuritalea sp.]
MTPSAVANRPAEQIYQSLNAAPAKSASVIDAAENRFLTLLTAQLKNQDPLNPLDNAQLTSQLAQISTVNGIEKLNATLQKLLAGMESSQAMEAAALVQRGVLVPGSSMTLGGQGGVGGLELAQAADAVTVTIKDGNGLVVRSLGLGALGAGVHAFVWDGKADGGAPAAPGNYSYSIGAQTGDKTSTPTALTYGVVQAVTRNPSGLTLEVGALGAFTLADVKQIL